MIREADEILRKLPGLDCGLCGAPTCKEMARDISIGDATRSECVFLSRDKLQSLRARYLGSGTGEPS